MGRASLSNAAFSYASMFFIGVWASYLGAVARAEPAAPVRRVAPCTSEQPIAPAAEDYFESPCKSFAIILDVLERVAYACL